VTKNSPARGRRPGSPDTRERILEVARRRFLADGFHAVTLRSVAAEAGVDGALPSYFFGSKQGLFAAALALPVNPADVLEQALAGPTEGLAARVLRGVLATWSDPESGAALQALTRTALAEPTMTRVVREAVGQALTGAVAARLRGPDADRRAAAITTQIAGLIFSRYLLGLEPMASLPAEEVVRVLAPALQLLVDG
jgi:AcrR family transcriptional regulator